MSKNMPKKNSLPVAVRTTKEKHEDSEYEYIDLTSGSIMSLLTLQNPIAESLKPKSEGVQSRSILEEYFYLGEKEYSLGNYEKAFPHFKSAARGYPPAYLRLIRMYKIGLGVDKNPRLEKECQKKIEGNIGWFKDKAKGGDPVAQFSLGICYINGVGVLKNESLGAEYYRKAAKQGFVLALRYLALCYLQERGVQENNEMAGKCYQEAVNQGDPAVFFIIGCCSFFGLCCEKSENNAISWYLKAAEKGHIGAKKMLEFMSNGFCSKHPQEALKLYYQAGGRGCDITWNLNKLVKQHLSRASNQSSFHNELNSRHWVQGSEVAKIKNSPPSLS